MNPDSGIRWSPGSELTLQVGSIEIQLRALGLQDVIRSATFDAVVSSDDAMLSMSGGVSRAIRELAGNVRDEVASQLPLPVGSIAVTSGGALSVKSRASRGDDGRDTGNSADAQNRPPPDARDPQPL